MSTKKTAFRLAIQETPKGLREQNYRNKRTDVDPKMVHENSPLQATNAIWQHLAPELRAEAVRKAQLVQLLKQINPELQLCRKSGSESQPVQPARHTIDRGVQVPDIRYEFASGRNGRSPLNYSGLGVRIQPKFRNEDLSQTLSSYGSTMVQYPIRLNQSLYSRPTDLDFSRSAWKRPITNQRSQQVNIKNQSQRQPNKSTVSRGVGNRKQPNQGQSFLDNSTFEQSNNKENIPKNKTPKHAKIEILKQEQDNADKQKQTITSSGDDDSVVVVLNKPTKEHDLERKCGQFFCRRCLRAWQSRNVWCVLSTSKVYIKQTCNTCNNVVNPYLVYELPPSSNNNNNRVAPKWKSNKSGNVSEN